MLDCIFLRVSTYYLVICGGILKIVYFEGHTIDVVSS